MYGLQAPQTPSSEPKLTDSGRLPDAQTPQGEARGKSRSDRFLDAQSAKKSLGELPKAPSREELVVFRGEKITVNPVYMPVDKPGMDFVEDKIVWLISLPASELPGFVKILTLEELRVFNSVISEMAGRRGDVNVINENFNPVWQSLKEALRLKLTDGLGFRDLPFYFSSHVIN